MKNCIKTRRRTFCIWKLWNQLRAFFRPPRDSFGDRQRSQKFESGEKQIPAEVDDEKKSAANIFGESFSFCIYCKNHLIYARDES